jgi:CTP:molybdopterin cytidylyltransferase MocA
MERLRGDARARSLTTLHADLIREVEADDNAPLTDIDTPEALAAILITWF